MPLNPFNPNEELPITYYGPRFKDSLEMHKAYANKKNYSDGTDISYRFKFPPNMNVIEAM